MTPTHVDQSSAQIALGGDHNETFWRILAKGEVPGLGERLWFAFGNYLRSAIYMGPGIWINPATGKRFGVAGQTGDGFDPPYWIPEPSDGRVPIAPGHDAAIGIMFLAQGMVCYSSSDPVPFTASYRPKEDDWVNEDGEVVDVRFWKYPETAEADLARKTEGLVDPQETFEDIN